jgi:(S)-2-hydroxyglutarate dehydrogenase
MLDFAIVGGGIVGLSTAMQLARALPGAGIALIEKEERLAAHQTGRNSGVVHAGVYYEPGSLKARFSKEGSREIAELCQEAGIGFERCGKLIVATDPAEIPRLDALELRAQANGLELERLDAAELARREPRIAGRAALYVPATAITDYTAVSRAMEKEFIRLGGEIRYRTCITGIVESPDRIRIETDKGTLDARYLVGCAGLFADRLAALSGIALDFRIVPFRGEYFRLREGLNDIVRHLIYPVPDPSFPFLGVHLTRMIGGYVTVGPNAVLSLKREGYFRSAFSFRDAASFLSYPGFWKFLSRNLAPGLAEMRGSLSKRHYLSLCRRYCPELKIEDLQPHPSGVRAQAMFADGRLAHDFIIRRTARSIHVCNAPSPAATASIPIGRHIVSEITSGFDVTAHVRNG